VKIRLSLFSAVFFFCLPACVALGWNQSQSSGKTKSGGPPSSSGATSEGERRFRANCGRCHRQPEAISPREAVAVVRQMRVRAMLSAEDERLIMKFLAP